MNAQKNNGWPVASAVVAGVIIVCAPLSASAGPAVDEMTGAFLKHVQQSETFPKDARQFIAKAWSDRQEDDDAEEFLLEALAVLSATFRDGLDAYDDEDYDKSFGVMNGLSGDGDPYIAANATVYAIKSLIEQNKVEAAATAIEAFLVDPTAVDLYTPYAAEIAFLKGYAELQMLQYGQAAKSLRRMLTSHAEAAQRLRVSARQMLAELARREPERLGDVADLMVYAGRRLGHRYTNDSVQSKQLRAIELLDALIEEAEQNEQGGGGGSGSGGSGQQSPQSPMPDSQLPGGSAAEGTNLRSARKIRPGTEWGAMPPAEREKILQSLRDSFPSRYRKLVEQYYQDLSKKP